MSHINQPIEIFTIIIREPRKSWKVKRIPFYDYNGLKRRLETERDPTTVRYCSSEFMTWKNFQYIEQQRKYKNWERFQQEAAE